MKRVLALIAVSAAAFGSTVLAACIGDEPGALPPIPQKDGGDSDTYVPPDNHDAGPPVPQEVDGLLLWLDGADSNSVQRKKPGTDETVVKWVDKSAKKNDYAPRAPEKAPKFAPGSMNGNTMSSVVFSNAGGTYLVGPVISSAEAEAFVVLHPAKRTIGLPPDAKVAYGLWQFGKLASAHPNANGHVQDSFGSLSDQTFFGAVAAQYGSISSPHIYSVVATQHSWDCFFNGALVNLNRPNPYKPGFNPNGSLLGASNNDSPLEPNQFFNGYIAEVIIYGKQLPPADHDKIQAYLAAKWGIALNDGGT
ncbi:hypothetical protein LZC95_32320 [Pendulispora brunnea]|uniref:LamG domain-containing protein n=1 Tax=Pendulispora brunnea TaxID=2905690 RepID=A0ABZ2JXB4_9BACT